uniref:septal ring lytic transglycosylase RlpA family protein n=1 Tax=Endozoicomonas sp. Mp262 TaxID=2919499 RepID=UPI00351AE81E
MTCKLLCLQLQASSMVMVKKPVCAYGCRGLMIQLLKTEALMENLSSRFRYWAFGMLAAALGGCTTTATTTTEEDGPPKGHVDVSLIPDAVPEPHSGRLKHSPYKLRGVSYKPLKTAKGYSREGIASWYGTKFHGRQTANGEVYDMFKMTAAHKTLPLPSYVKVTNLENNRSVVLRVNDRGPFKDDRLIDVSYVAAKKLGFANSGVSKVKIEGIDPGAFLTSKERKKDEDSLIYLQLAALKNFHNAHVLRREVFDKLGVKVSIVANDDEVNPYYRVRVGPVESPEHMEELLEQLAESRYDTPFIVYE